MKAIDLKNLLDHVPHIETFFAKNLSFDSIVSNSKKVTSSSIFVAIKGAKNDGHDFIEEVISRNPVAIVVEDLSRVPKHLFQDDGNNLTRNVVLVAHAREFLNRAIAYTYNDPSKELVCVGVTGTNGKTTTTHIVEVILNDQQLPCAVMGTIDHHLGETIFPSDMTTPDPEVLHRRLREFCDQGAKAVAIEISSHALEQRRSDSLHFDVAVFTNLTRDHLDYHKTMEEYFAAKQRLFDDVIRQSEKRVRAAVINVDDSFGSWLKVADGVKVYYYGLNDADLLIRNVQESLNGVRFEIGFKTKQYQIQSHLIGLHNVYNLTAAFGVAAALGLDLEIATNTLSNFPGVKGRLERVETSRGIHVFVDYAHTDDALKNVLYSLKTMRDQFAPAKKIITIFGCGGDRDKGKRPLMAHAAESFSDLVVVTSDNPRTEAPQQIISEICEGFSQKFRMANVLTEVDRQKGIEIALKQAVEGDIVLIAGKGHEDYQIIGQEKKPFSDVIAVRNCLMRLY